MTGDEKVKKSRDPIFTTCFVIFMVAFVAILGVYVNDHYLEKDNTQIAYGDKVVVNYTGSYYDYVGEDLAVVFDTSYSSVGNDDGIIKSNSFTKTSYSTLSFTVGDGKMLKAFEDAVVGHKVGDKVQVKIDAGNGYVAPDDGATASFNNFTVQTSEVMPKAAFEGLYEDVDLVKGVQSAVFKSVYGWDAVAIQTGNDVVVSYINVESGETYAYIGNEDSKFGKAEFKVNSISNGNIVCDLSLTETVSTGGADGEIQMLELDFGTETMYITNISGGEYTYKTCDEKCNIDLYFEIEIVSIN